MCKVLKPNLHIDIDYDTQRVYAFTRQAPWYKKSFQGNFTNLAETIKQLLDDYDSSFAKFAEEEERQMKKEEEVQGLLNDDEFLEKLYNLVKAMR